MFKKIFSFEGRIRRTEYALTFIIYVVLANIINIIIDSSGLNSDAEILGLLYIPMVWILLAQGAKRSHDIGDSGWWQLIPLYVLWLFFKNGNQGYNSYGGDPKTVHDKYGFQGEIYNEHFDLNTNNPQQENFTSVVVGKQERIAGAKKDIIFGFLWGAGGAFLTAQDIGYIFWGAIVYGTILFFKGVLILAISMLSPDSQT